MSNGVKYIFTFALGATAGALVAWKVLDKYYKHILDEEAEAFRAAIANQNTENADKTEETYDRSNREVVEEDRKSYANIIARGGYANYEDAKDGFQDDIYVISPEAFDEYENYDVHSLTYYSDGVLTDEQDNVIDDIDAVVGLESLETFGMYETDAVYVRNDRLKTDYEILLDMRPYSEVVGSGPHIAEASYDPEQDI